MLVIDASMVTEKPLSKGIMNVSVVIYIYIYIYIYNRTFIY